MLNAYRFKSYYAYQKLVWKVDNDYHNIERTSNVLFLVGENMKEKNILNLCFKYNQSCKQCPRNAKCQRELERGEEHVRKINTKTRKVRAKPYQRHEST